MATSANIWTQLSDLKSQNDPGWQKYRPATPTDNVVMAFEQELGMPMPVPLRLTFSQFAGAVGVWSQPENESDDDSEEDEFDFGDVSFMTLSGSLEMRETQKALSDIGDYLNVVGPCRSIRFDPGRIAFASDVGAGVFWVDMNPATGGQVGQICWTLEETSTIMAVAPDLQTFLKWGLACLKFEQGLSKRMPKVPYVKSTAAELQQQLTAEDEVLRQNIADVWNEIKQLSKARKKLNLPSYEYCDTRYLKASSLEQIRRVEKRLKCKIPLDLQFSMETVGAAGDLWIPADLRVKTGAFKSSNRPATFDLWGVSIALEMLCWPADYVEKIGRVIANNGIERTKESRLVPVGNVVAAGCDFTYYVEAFGSERSQTGRVIVAEAEYMSAAWVTAETWLSFLQQGAECIRKEVNK